MQSYASQLSLNDLGSMDDLTENVDTDVEMDDDNSKMQRVEPDLEKTPRLAINGTDTQIPEKIQQEYERVLTILL